MTGLLILLLIWFGLPLLFVVVLVGGHVLDGGRPPKHRVVKHHMGESWTCACGVQTAYMTDGTYEDFLRVEDLIEQEVQEHMKLNDNDRSNNG